jgi:hypothetical protein
MKSAQMLPPRLKADASVCEDNNYKNLVASVSIFLLYDHVSLVQLLMHRLQHYHGLVLIVGKAYFDRDYHA